MKRKSHPAAPRLPRPAPPTPTPSYPVVVEVLAVLRAEDLDHHAVEMQPLHQHPREGAQEEVVEEHGQHLAGDLAAKHTGRGSELWVCAGRFRVSRPPHPLLGASAGHVASCSSWEAWLHFLVRGTWARDSGVTSHCPRPLPGTGTGSGRCGLRRADQHKPHSLQQGWAQDPPGPWGGCRGGRGPQGARCPSSLQTP